MSIVFRKEREQYHEIQDLKAQMQDKNMVINELKKLILIVQLILFIVDSGCTKHMTGNLKLLCNFVEKFLGTVRFGNDQLAQSWLWDMDSRKCHDQTGDQNLVQSCDMSKSKRSSFKTKAVHSSKGRLICLHGLVWSNASCKHLWDDVFLGIVDGYSRYLGLFFTSKDESPEFSKTFSGNDQSSYPLYGKTDITSSMDRKTFKYNIYKSLVALANKLEMGISVESIHIKFDEIKEMVSDHNSLDLAPQRQEMSVENVASGLVTQGQKASDYDNSDPCPQDNVVHTEKKTVYVHQGLRISLQFYLMNITI
ncbi:hypothetical protein Tco_0067019 [Tanacetum coccineum]